jgi:regulatory protein
VAAEDRRASRSKRPPEPLSRESLERAALRYLNRFDASVDKLRRVLEAHTGCAARSEPRDDGETAHWIDELIERYRASGLLDDQRYAMRLIEGQRSRGVSQKQIRYKLYTRGVSGACIDAAFQATESRGDDAELEAAQRFAKKRRLGRFRAPAERASFRRKDLAALARAGFSYEQALRVLGPGDDEEAF